jgi:steroid delta-isomerase-like uncharacterized protein
MSEENKTTARRAFEEGWNEGRLEVADEISTPDAVNHDAQDPFPELRGPESPKRLISMYREAFPDTHMTVEQQIAEGDFVVTRWRATGTHRGELMGLAPTGKQVEVTGITIDRFEGGKIAESWTNWDTLGLMQQIGAAPARGSAGEKIGVQVQRLFARRERKKTGIA